MDVPINFQGNYHHIEISEGACLQIAQGVTMRSFTSLEVFMGAILSIEEGVFLMIIVQFGVRKKSPLDVILCLGMESEFLIQIISLTTIMCLKLQ